MEFVQIILSQRRIILFNQRSRRQNYEVSLAFVIDITLILEMQQVSIPLNPTDKDIQKLRELFRKCDNDHDNRINSQQLSLLCSHLVNKPKPYDITDLFASSHVKTVGVIEEETFVIWYLAYNLGVAHIVDAYLFMKALQESTQTAAPSLEPSRIMNSFVKKVSNDKPIRFKTSLILNPQQTKIRLQQYEAILKKIIAPVCLTLRLKVNGNANTIRERLESTVEIAKEIMKELGTGAEDIINLIDVSCGNTQDQVFFVVETKYPLFSLLAQEFNRVMASISSNIFVELNVNLKSDSLEEMVTNAKLLDFEVDLKVDSFLMERVKYALLERGLVESPLGRVFMFLFEELKLDVKTKDFDPSLFSGLQIPKLDLNATIQGIRNQVNPKELMEAFLPPEAHELLTLLQDHGTGDLEINLFLGCLNIQVYTKLDGLGPIYRLLLE